MTVTKDENPRPRRGRPPALDRAKIVRAAAKMDPNTLTMQSVADKLGVDRKTLRSHVNDRDGLMTLLASTALQTRLARTSLPAHDDWRATVREYATSMRASIAAMGHLAGYVNFQQDSGIQGLDPAESLLKTLVAAGFHELTAGRALAFIAEFVFTSARNQQSASEAGEHPQIPALQQALADTDQDRHSVLRRVLEADDHFGASQFQFDLDLLILGMERLLELRGSNPPAP